MICVSFWSLQTVRYQLRDCGQMISRVQQAMQQIVSVQEPKFSGIDELRRLQRRHADVTDRVTKLYDRASRAAEVRKSFWSRYSALDDCFGKCHSDVARLASSTDDVDAKLKLYEASLLAVYCYDFFDESSLSGSVDASIL